MTISMEEMTRFDRRLLSGVGQGCVGDDEGLDGLAAAALPPGVLPPKKKPATARQKRGVIERLTRSVRKRTGLVREASEAGRELVDETRRARDDVREDFESEPRSRGFPWGKILLAILGVGGAVAGARALARRKRAAS